MYGAPRRSSSFSIAGTSVSTSVLQRRPLGDEELDAICNCWSCVAVCRRERAVQLTADRVRALRDRHRARPAARPEPPIARSSTRIAASRRCSDRASGRAACAARPASRRAPSRSRRAACSCCWRARVHRRHRASAPGASPGTASARSDRPAWCAAWRIEHDIERHGAGKLRHDAAHALRQRDGVAARHDIRADRRIAEELLELTARTVRRQLMRRRAQIPRDALHPLLRSGR